MSASAFLRGRRTAFKLRQITRARVEAYLAQLDAAAEISHKTANESLGPLRQILARAVREGVIANNPAVSVDATHPSTCRTTRRRSNR